MMAAACTPAVGSASSAPVPSANLTNPAPKPSIRESARSVFIVGDSNSTGFGGTFAAGAASGDAWAARLPAECFTPINGWAVDGATSGAMLAGVETLSVQTDQLIVMAGTNDLAAGILPDGVVANIAAIVNHVPNASVLILAIAPFDALAVQATALNSELREEAVDRGWDYVDPWVGSRAADGTWIPSRTIDGVHATREGYDAAGDIIANYLVGKR